MTQRIHSVPHTQIYKRMCVTMITAVLLVVAGTENNLGVHHWVGKGKCNRYKTWATVQDTRQRETWIDPDHSAE